MNEKKVVSGKGIPQSHLPFSPAIQSGNYLFISGQASVNSQGKIVPGTFEEECRRSFENLKAILQGAGLDFYNLVQVRNYVGKQENIESFNNIYREYFSNPYPARTTLVGCLGDLLKFEVDAIAFIK